MERTTLIRVTGCAFIALTAAAVTTHAGRQDAVTEERAIRALERQVEAASNRNDVHALSMLWAPDYLFVNPAGQRLTGADRLDMFRRGTVHYDRYKVDQETVRIYGDTAIVFYGRTSRVAAARWTSPACGE